MFVIAAAPTATFSFEVWVWPLLLLLAVGTGSAVLLRWSGMRRAGVCAGVVAGVVCGTTVLGGAFPELHERLFRGGRAEREALAELRQEHEVNLLALAEVGVSEIAIVEKRAEQERIAAEAVESHAEAVWRHGRGLRFCGLLLTGLFLGWLLPWGRGANGSKLTAGDQDDTAGECVSSWSDAVFVALWMLVLILGFVGGAVLLVFSSTRLEAFGVSLAFGVTAAALGNNALKSVGIQRIALVGWLVGLAALFVAFTGLIVPEGAVGGGVEFWMIAGGGASLLVGIFLRGIESGSVSAGGGRLLRRVRYGLGGYVVVPLVTGLLCLQIEFTASAALLWPAALGMLVGGDGRWFGAASGMRLTGRDWTESMYVVLPLADAGAVQVLVGFGLVTAGWIVTPGSILMVVAGAVLCDLLAGKRGQLLRHLQAELTETAQGTGAGDDDVNADNDADNNER